MYFKLMARCVPYHPFTYGDVMGIFDVFFVSFASSETQNFSLGLKLKKFGRPCSKLTLQISEC